LILVLFAKSMKDIIANPQNLGQAIAALSINRSPYHPQAQRLDVEHHGFAAIASLYLG
jgi:hypothetical protein